ncbi:hypothetical protein C8R44DRAFT_790667 [Mycena epipterygia]|nr:hypothetical protein C8R44DRAFT_790667 [Mycena epipterygia]
MFGLFGLRTVIRPMSRPLWHMTRRLHTHPVRGNTEQDHEFHWWDSSGGQRISTLNSERLTVDDIVKFDYNGSLHIHFDGIYPDVWIHQKPVPGERGFLYYHSLPGSPALASSLRLRLIQRSSVEAFHSGHDFRLENGLVWQLIAGQMAIYDIYEGLRKQLIQEGLWTDEDQQNIFNVFRDRGVLFPERTLFHLEQEFPFTLNGNLTLTMVGKNEHRNFAMHVLGTGDKGYRWPFSGNTIARFERSTHPECVSRPAVCIRIMRVFTPIRRLIYGYTGPHCKPVAGELLSVVTPSGEIRPWTYPLTKNENSRALGLLMD